MHQQQQQQEQALLYAFRQLDAARRAFVVSFVQSTVIELGRSSTSSAGDQGSGKPN